MYGAPVVAQLIETLGEARARSISAHARTRSDGRGASV